jgi:hypothetical protein
MNKWIYNVPKYLHPLLMDEFNDLHIISTIQNIQNEALPGDLLVCMWDDEPTLSQLTKLSTEVNVFPTRELIDFSANREKMTKFVQEHSKFTAEREYFKFTGEQIEITVPRLKNSLQVVAKVGEEHRGQDKFLLYPGQKLYVKNSVLFEEYVIDAVSFRVLLIGDHLFIIEYNNDPNQLKADNQTWIKNINAILIENEDHSSYEEVIEDTISLSKKLGYDYIGVDYVRNEQKTVCLELNIFPGIRLNDRTKAAGQAYWFNKIKELS